jgi:hypothetical protein
LEGLRHLRNEAARRLRNVAALQRYVAALQLYFAAPQHNFAGFNHVKRYFSHRYSQECIQVIAHCTLDLRTDLDLAVLVNKPLELIDFDRMYSQQYTLVVPHCIQGLNTGVAHRHCLPLHRTFYFILLF